MRIIVDGKRYDTDKLTEIFKGCDEIGTGITLTSIRMTPRTKTVIVGTYSIWEDRFTHGVVGQSYHIASAEEIAQLANEYDSEELAALVPEGD